jgi:hypothetical protein
MPMRPGKGAAHLRRSRHGAEVTNTTALWTSKLVVQMEYMTSAPDLVPMDGPPTE